MRLQWDQTGERLYETGIKNGVLYPIDANNTYSNGYAWNGLTGVTENPSGAEATKLYADDIKYLELYSAEEFGATVEAYTYPDEFAECDGSAVPLAGVSLGQQNRKMFGLSYVTTLGNDAQGNEYGYKLHLIYGAKASPSEKGYQTINDSPEAITFSWEMTTTPVNVTGYKPTASMVIDSTKVTDPTKLAALETILYGTDGTPTYNAAANGDIFSAVTSPSGNPVTKKYYERSGASAPYTYTLSADTEVDDEKTYYVAASPMMSGWYERSGSGEPYTYTKSTDSVYDGSKTYYIKTSAGGTNPRLPLPDEVISILGTAG